MLPIALRPGGRRAVIVGGGNVALRKAEALIAGGFQVCIIAPQIDTRLRALAEATGGTCRERCFEPGDLAGALLAIAATDSPAVNAHAVSEARTQGILCCDAIAPESGDFTMLATVRAGDLTFAVDSGGSTPAFSKRILREIEERFGPQYAAAARTLARVRTYVKAVASDPQERAAVLRAFAERPIEELAHMNPIVAEHEVEHAIEHLRSDAEPKRTSSTICASRASALAMTQTKWVAARLAERGVATSILSMTTVGDRVQDRPLAAIGSVNVFVKELETALRERRADYAVHSCKDLPGELPPDMQLAAISVREDPRDAFCSERFASFDTLPAGAIVGTSSPRRRWQLAALRPDLEFRDIRGNVDTRLRKLRDGEYDAIVLAMAGLNRLHVRATHTVPFDVATVVPAVAQGALAVEVRAGDDALTARLREAVNDPAAECCVRSERAALRELRAGCDAPVGIHARLDGTVLTVDGVYAVPERGPIFREQVHGTATTLEAAESIGSELGRRLLAMLGSRAAPESSLHGRRVLLPRTQARPSRIAAALRERGVTVIELTAAAPMASGAATMPDLLAFPSSGSVAAAAPYLAELRNRPQRPRVAAMGPQSARAASEAGFAPDAVCEDASIESFVTMISEQLYQL
ncbi:MAG: hydroxymethylbilane synthase [Vulcanimicrobiaceae bacterium]